MALDLTQVDIRCGDGWVGIIERMLDELNAASLPVSGLVAGEDQGRLRVDYNVPLAISLERSRAVMRVLLLAQFRSLYTCEKCGQPGEHRSSSGWRTTRCADHAVNDPKGTRPIYDQTRRPWRETPQGVVEYDPGRDALSLRPQP